MQKGFFQPVSRYPQHLKGLADQVKQLPACVECIKRQFCGSIPHVVWVNAQASTSAFLDLFEVEQLFAECSHLLSSSQQL